MSREIIHREEQMISLWSTTDKEKGSIHYTPLWRDRSQLEPLAQETWAEAKAGQQRMQGWPLQNGLAQLILLLNRSLG